jgi:hypothetical protein
MLTTEQINDLHRLYWSEHWPIRKIERHLNMGWKTIRKYLDAPAQGPVHRDRPSKLDPFKGAVAKWLEKDPGPGTSFQIAVPPRARENAAGCGISSIASASGSRPKLQVSREYAAITPHGVPPSEIGIDAEPRQPEAAAASRHGSVRGSSRKS